METQERKLAKLTPCTFFYPQDIQKSFKSSKIMLFFFLSQPIGNISETVGKGTSLKLLPWDALK